MGVCEVRIATTQACAHQDTSPETRRFVCQWTYLFPVSQERTNTVRCQKHFPEGNIGWQEFVRKSVGHERRSQRHAAERCQLTVIHAR